MTTSERTPHPAAAGRVVLATGAAFLLLCVSACSNSTGSRDSVTSASNGSPTPEATQPSAAASSAGTFATWDPTRLPDTKADAAAMLKQLPATLGGLPLQHRGATSASYGTGSRTIEMTVQSLAQAAGPNAKMSTFFPAFAKSGQVTVSNSRLSGTGLWYLEGADTDSHHSIAAWAAASGHYLFGIDASTPDLLTSSLPELRP